MISVINRDFFTMRRHTIPYNGSGPEKFITLVNLYTDPKMAELNKYEKKAFMSFVFKSRKNPENLSESDIYNIMESSELEKHSSYTDNRYDEIKEMFPSDIRYPTIIFEATDSYNAINLCLIAIPIKGIVPVIKKSDTYSLYNGSLVVCKMFKYQSQPSSDLEFYNKLIYILVDIKSTFSFTEYLGTENDLYGIAKTYSTILHPKESNISIDEDEGTFQTEFILTQENTLVPYKGRREEFFEPTQKPPNIFKLSDIPPEVHVKNNSIIKELKG